MNPQQPYQPQVPQQPLPPQAPQVPQMQQMPQPSPNPQYDFIMNHGQQQQSGRFNLPSGNSPIQRILIFAGGIVGLLIVFLVFMSIIGGGSDRSTQLLSLAQDQTELIRIADLGQSERTVRQPTTKNLAANTSVSIASIQKQTLVLIKDKKAASKLGLKKSAKTDATLTTAAANNQYDSVFVDLLTTKLKSYRTEIKTLFTSAKSAKEKKVLQDAYNGASLLLGEPIK